MGDNSQLFIYKIVTLLILYYCVLNAVKEKNLFNVYVFFALTPLSLFLYDARFSPNYLENLSSETWIIGIINMLAFLISYKFFDYNKKNEIVEKLDDYDKCKIKKHIYILCISGIIPVIFMLLGITIHLASFIHFFSYLGLGLAFKLKEKKMIIFALFSVLFSFITDFNKNNVVMVVICCMIFYETYFLRTAKDKRKLFFGGLLSILFMIFVAFPLKDYIRGGGSYTEYAENSSQISDEAFTYYTDQMVFNGPEVLKMPIMYLISPWNNLQYVMNTQDWRTYGLWLIRPFLNYFGAINSLETAYFLEPRYTSFNTYTYIAVGFKDFGFWGSIIMSVFLGIFVKYVFSKYQKDGSAFDITSCGLVGMAVFQMYFNNHFFMQAYPFTIVIVGYLYKKIFHLEKY